MFGQDGEGCVWVKVSQGHAVKGVGLTSFSKLSQTPHSQNEKAITTKT
jgi:hypothetical protein